MSTVTISEEHAAGEPLRDYSLVGVDAARAVDFWPAYGGWYGMSWSGWRRNMRPWYTHDLHPNDTNNLLFLDGHAETRQSAELTSEWSTRYWRRGN